MAGIDMSRVQRSILDDAVTEAREFTSQGKRSEAAMAWERAAKLADFYASSARTSQEKKHRTQTAEEFAGLAKKLRVPLEPSLQSAPNKHVDANEFENVIRQLIHKSKVGFEQIAGLKQTQREIQSAYAISMISPPQGIVLPFARNILFYGPPGCGKTLLAGAVSKGLDATFYSVKVGDLLSKYYGDSSKLVKALYDDARRHPISVVFLDEIDAIASHRETMDNAADKKLLVSLLTELDGLNNKSGVDGSAGNRVLTIAATNLPWGLDSAILSRFQKQVHIPLPDELARREMLKIQILDKGFTTSLSSDEFVDLTKQLSGREIEQLAGGSIEAMLDEVNPSLVEMALKGRDALSKYELTVKPVTRVHFEMVRAQIRPVTAAKTTERYNKWQSNSR